MLDLFSVSIVMIRGLALLVILNVISGLPAAVTFVRRQSLPDESSLSPDYTIAVAMLTYILTATILLASAKSLGRVLTRGLDNSSIQVDESNLRVLQAVAFSLLGAYVLVYSIPTLVKMLFIATVPVPRDEPEGLFRNVGTRSIPFEQIVQELAKTAIGAWLLFGGKRIVVSARTFWKKSLAADGDE